MTCQALFDDTDRANVPKCRKLTEHFLQLLSSARQRAPALTTARPRPYPGALPGRGAEARPSPPEAVPDRPGQRDERATAKVRVKGKSTPKDLRGYAVSSSRS